MSWKSELRLGRAVAAAVLATIVTIVIVGTAIVIRSASELGPNPSPEDVQALADRTGLLVGPIVGLVTTLLGGWWAARGMERHAVAQGLVVGLIVALVGLLFEGLSGRFDPLVAAIRAVEVGAGGLGGWIAGRRAVTAPQTVGSPQ